MRYDYLIVGAGLFGAVFAHEAKKKGKRCLVIDKRPHIAGNVYCEDIEGILILSLPMIARIRVLLIHATLSSCPVLRQRRKKS